MVRIAMIVMGGENFRKIDLSEALPNQIHDNLGNSNSRESKKAISLERNRSV